MRGTLCNADVDEERETQGDLPPRVNAKLFRQENESCCPAGRCLMSGYVNIFTLSLFFFFVTEINKASYFEGHKERIRFISSLLSYMHFDEPVSDDWICKHHHSFNVFFFFVTEITEVWYFEGHKEIIRFISSLLSHMRFDETAIQKGKSV